MGGVTVPEAPRVRRATLRSPRASPPAAIPPEPLPAFPVRCVVLMIGIAGSGKSTYLGRYHCPTLASDCLRQLLFDDERDQRAPEQVFDLLRRLLLARLQFGVPRTFIDATNLTTRARQPLIHTATQFQAPVVAIWMDTPLDECLRRNAQREIPVPAEVLRRMAPQLRPPTAKEGVTRLYRIAADGRGAWVY